MLPQWVRWTLIETGLNVLQPVSKDGIRNNDICKGQVASAAKQEIILRARRRAQPKSPFVSRARGGLPAPGSRTGYLPRYLWRDPQSVPDDARPARNANSEPLEKDLASFQPAGIRTNDRDI